MTPSKALHVGFRFLAHSSQPTSPWLVGWLVGWQQSLAKKRGTNESQMRWARSGGARTPTGPPQLPRAAGRVQRPPGPLGLHGPAAGSPGGGTGPHPVQRALQKSDGGQFATVDVKPT